MELTRRDQAIRHGRGETAQNGMDWRRLAPVKVRPRPFGTE